MVRPEWHHQVKEVKIDSKGHWGAWEIRKLLVVGLYAPPSMKRDLPRTLDEIWTLLQERDQPALLLGDWNTTFPDIPRSLRDRHWKEWISDPDLTVLTKKARNGDGSSTVSGKLLDHAVGFRLGMEGSACPVRHPDTRRSDHFAVEGRLWWNPPREDRTTTRDPVRRWKLTRLLEDDVRQSYARQLEEAILPVGLRLEHILDASQAPEAIWDRQAQIDCLYAEVIDTITTTADQAIGRVRGTSRRPPPRPDSQQIAEWRRQADTLYNQLPVRSDPTYRDKLTAIQVLNTQINTERAKARREGYRSFVEKIDEIDISQYFRTLSRMKRAKQRRLEPPLTDDVIEGGVHHFENALCPCGPTTSGIPRQIPHAEADCDPGQGDPMIADLPWEMESAVTGRNIERIIVRGANGKAPGSDGITKELMGITYDPDAHGRAKISEGLARTLSALFMLISEWGTPPSDWSKAVLVTLYKGKGRRDDWKNQRPISLLQYLRKVYELCHQRLIVMDGFHPIQGGFCPSKSTLDQVSVLDQALHTAKRQGKHVYVAFLDIWGAYDGVPRDILWNEARRRGTPERLIRILGRLFARSTTQLRVGHRLSRPFEPKASVPQGDPISPQLYNVFIDTLPQRIDEHVEGVKFAAGTRVPGALFADDVALVTTSHQEMVAALEICEEHSREFRYRWKPIKSEYFTNDPAPQPLHLYGEELRKVSAFTYLGVPMTADGVDMDLLLEKNIRRYDDGVAEMARCGINPYGWAPFRAAMAYKVFLRSKLEYGLGLRALTPAQYRALEKAQLRGIRRLIGGHRGSAHEVMRRLAEAIRMTTRHQELQARHFVRSLTTGTTSLLRRVMDVSLQDPTSPLRKAMAANKVWQEVTEGKRIPAGRSIPRLWSAEERLAQWVNRTSPDLLPYPHRDDGTLASADDIDPIRAKLVRTVRKQTLHPKDHADAYVERREGTGTLIESLPFHNHRSPLRKMRLTLTSRRQLIGWWMGAFPGHIVRQQCGLCNQMLPEIGIRRHIATCVRQRYNWLPENTEELDAISGFFMNITREGPIEGSRAITITRLLTFVGEIVLGRRPGGHNARAGVG